MEKDINNKGDGEWEQHKYHRRSIRLKGYDYSQAGAYFVTMNLYGREPYLEIPEVRRIVEETWFALPQRYPSIELDEFVIMPDHIHFILWLHPQPGQKNRPTLSSIVCAFKSLSARAALAHLRTLGDICGDHFWHRDFYDYIIPNHTALHQIRIYIHNNPTKNEPPHRERG
jgi:putative transposase